MIYHTYSQFSLPILCATSWRMPEEASTPGNRRLYILDDKSNWLEILLVNQLPIRARRLFFSSSTTKHMQTVRFNTTWSDPHIATKFPQHFKSYFILLPCLFRRLLLSRALILLSRLTPALSCEHITLSRVARQENSWYRKVSKA